MPVPEISESGNPIYRYDLLSQKAFTPATGAGENIETISGHIERNIGKIETVFHEIVSHLVHIDIHWVKPNNNFPFNILVTSGMSDKPMVVPEGTERSKYAELCILLPKDWKISDGFYQTMEDAFKDEYNYWPVRWLKTIARFPHEYDTWVGYGHTIPNGEHAEPFSENTKLGCMLLLPSLTLGEQFFELKISDEKTINFYCLYPVYKEEMEFKISKGTEKLLDKFDKYKISDIVDINRVNTCLKKDFWGFLKG